MKMNKVITSAAIVYCFFAMLYLTLIIVIASNFDYVKSKVSYNSKLVRTIWWFVKNSNGLFDTLDKHEITEELTAECSRRYFGLHYGKQIRMLWCGR